MEARCSVYHNCIFSSASDYKWWGVGDVPSCWLAASARTSVSSRPLNRIVLTPSFANALAFSSPRTTQVMVEAFNEACSEERRAASIEPPLVLNISQSSTKLFGIEDPYM